MRQQITLFPSPRPKLARPSEVPIITFSNSKEKREEAAPLVMFGAAVAAVATTAAAAASTGQLKPENLSTLREKSLQSKAVVKLLHFPSALTGRMKKKRKKELDNWAYLEQTDEVPLTVDAAEEDVDADDDISRPRRADADGRLDSLGLS